MNDPLDENPSETSIEADPPKTGRKRRRLLRVRRASAALVLSLIVVLSGAAGFTGGFFAMRILPGATPTPTTAVATLAPTSTAAPTPTAGSDSTVLTSATGTATKNGLTVAQIAAIAGPSVVEVHTTQTVTVRGQSYAVDGAGSGVVMTKDGYIVTNHHVIDGAKTVTVKLLSGTSYDAVVVNSDSIADIAVLKIAATNLTPATIGLSSALGIGDTAVAIGNPLGELGGTVTQGIISSLDRQIDLGGTTMTLLQTDAAINPGNSGGGLFNASGQLIGIVIAKSSGNGLEGLGFAIPIDSVKALIEKMIVTAKAAS